MQHKDAKNLHTIKLHINISLMQEKSQIMLKIFDCRCARCEANTQIKQSK